MDNLTSHYDPTTWALVTAAGHRFLPRAAYAACDGPIEYIFNALEGALRSRLHLIHNSNDLVNAIYNIVGNMVGFDRYFVHCGYV